MYKLALRILEKVADNEAKGIFHPKDAQAKIEETAFINDFHIIYGEKRTAVALINKMGDRRSNVVQKTETTTTEEIPDESIEEQNFEYLEEAITQAINEQQIKQYETDCQAIESLQAKSELNEVEQSALENHQSAKKLFEDTIKAIDKMIAQFRNSIDENEYIAEIPQFLHCHYTSSCDLIKAMESREYLSTKAQEVLKKHRLFVQEFEYYLKCFQHKLHAKISNCYERELLKTIKAITRKENDFRDRIVRIAKIHANSGKVDNVQDWNAKIAEYQFACKFVHDVEKRSPRVRTPKAKRLLLRRKEFLANFEAEVNAIENNFCYLDNNKQETKVKNCIGNINSEAVQESQLYYENDEGVVNEYGEGVYEDDNEVDDEIGLDEDDDDEEEGLNEDVDAADMTDDVSNVVNQEWRHM